MTFSLYENGIKNVFPSKTITILQFLEMLKLDNPLIEKIRLYKKKSQRDLLKQKLSYVTFAGTFVKRGKKHLIKGSGYATFDLDGVDNLFKLKEQIIKNEYTHLCFTSPSGNGLKFLVKIPKIESDEEYKKYWISISKYYNLPENDEANKDVSRACYLSVDKDFYFNSSSKVYINKIEEVLISPSFEIKNNINTPIKKSKINIPNISSEDFIETLKKIISMEELLRHFGVDTSKNPTDCPFHFCSQRCLSFNQEVCNCFDTDCGRGYNIFSFIQKIKNLTSAESIEWLANFAGLKKEFKKNKDNYFLNKKEPQGWANSISIKKLAKKYNLEVCPYCDCKLNFIERLGWWSCSNCNLKGGLNKFAALILNKSNGGLQ